MKFLIQRPYKVTFKSHVEYEDKDLFMSINNKYEADLAQLVERKALNLVVMGSSPMVGVD